MDFLYETGCPTLVMPGVWKKPSIPAPVVEAKDDYSEMLTKLMGDLNLCSREYKSRIYDGEVKGLSVVKPYVGVNADVPSDATVMRVEYDHDRGAVLAEGINPWFSDIDTYDMTTSVIDEAVRRVIAVGGDLNRIAILDNYCWPDPVESEKTPDGAYKMAQLVRSNKALYDLTTLYKTPAVSGKDSCKNDSTRGGKKISIPPTLLISSIGQIDDVKKAVTMPFKDAGDVIYVIGETKEELGASAYYRKLAEEQGAPLNYGGTVPAVDGEKALKIYAAMNKATDAELLKSATTPTKGGLAISLALATVGGQVGADVDLSSISDDAATALFSESNSRFVVTVAPEKVAELEVLFAELPIAKIGTVTSDKQLKIVGAVDVELDALVKPFKETLYGV
jgi:phosphoribosylformylglycinamidine synthase